MFFVQCYLHQMYLNIPHPSRAHALSMPIDHPLRNLFWEETLKGPWRGGRWISLASIQAAAQFFVKVILGVTPEATKDGISSLFHTRDPTLRYCPLWTSASRYQKEMIHFHWCYAIRYLLQLDYDKIPWMDSKCSLEIKEKSHGSA